MNVIEITVGDKNYKISCNPGEENHIQNLSAKLNERCNKLSETIGDKASETLMLVIICLMLEDEVANGNSNKNNQEKISQISKKLENLITRLEESA